MDKQHHVDCKALQIAMVTAGYNSYTSLAKDSGISARTISSVINGQNPTYPIMTKLVSVLKLSPVQAGKIFFAVNLRNKKVS